MNKLKEIISGVITTSPEVIQFSKDRKFEEAWIIPLSQTRPRQEEIDEYLQKEEFKTLIVEYIWSPENDEKRFVLTVFLDKKCLLQDNKKFIEICLDNFYSYKNFQTLLRHFDSQVVGRPYLLEKQVESVNLSVFNHWLSVGPVDLWKYGERYSNELTTTRIKSRPDIEKTSLNYQGLFFRFNVTGNLNGPYYGIKTPCCNKIGDSWIIDFNRLDYWMKIMINNAV